MPKGGNGGGGGPGGSSGGTIRGSKNNDILTGTAAAETIDGRDGDDVLAGLGGADTLIGGNGSDTATYAASAAGVAVSLETVTGMGGDAGGDALTGIENLTGSVHADSLTGDDGNNVLGGAAGDDTLEGGAGDDLIIGGAGEDQIDGGAGIDTVSYADAAHPVVVDQQEIVYLDPETFEVIDVVQWYGGPDGESLTGVERIIGSAFNDQITLLHGANYADGGGGDDTLIGNLSGDTLIGGAGADVLVGILGDDALTGGGGADLFVFFGSDPAEGGVADGDDLISDFEAGTDQIIFARSEFDVLGAAVQDGADVLIAYAEGNSIRLLDTALAGISETDFDYLDLGGLGEVF